MHRSIYLLVFTCLATIECHSQIIGTWTKYKMEVEKHLYYNAEEWQNDTLIFSATAFERKLATRKNDYKVGLKTIKGTYELSKKDLTFISNENLFSVKETYRYILNDFGELVIGTWFTPTDKNGNRDYRRERLRVWTYYKKIN